MSFSNKNNASTNYDFGIVEPISIFLSELDTKNSYHFLIVHFFTRYQYHYDVNGGRLISHVTKVDNIISPDLITKCAGTIICKDSYCYCITERPLSVS